MNSPNPARPPGIDDPVPVRFVLPDEITARWLDRMIARSGGDPDAWLTGVVEADRAQAQADGATRLAELGARLRAAAGNQGDTDLDGYASPTGAIAPRPAAARLPRASSAWRTPGGHPAATETTDTTDNKG